MPVGISQPMNQIKLTNVSLVRLKKGKKRFEIACYKNKILEWRNGTEKDIDNVLQIPEVFVNVNKGQTAPKADLEKAFGKIARDEVILEILNKGEIQVGDKERHAELERMHAEVIDIVAGKLVDPKTKRVYTPGMIEKALDILTKKGAEQGGKVESKPGSGSATPGTPAVKSGDVADAGEHKPKKHSWTGVVTTKSAKSQALEAMKALIEQQPIAVQRARMRLRVTCPAPALKQAVKTAPKASNEDGETPKATGTVKDKILAAFEQVESQDVMGDEWEATGFAEPGVLKILGDFLTTETKGRGRVEVLDMAVVNEGEGE